MKSIVKEKHLLLNPPIRSSARYGTLASSGSYLPPFGLLYIATYANQQGYEVDVLDAEARGLEIQDAVDIVRNEAYRTVGITAVTMVIDAAGAFAKKLKSICPDIKVIIGGAHITSQPEATLLTFSSIDYGVVGEGEYTYCEWLSCVEENREYHHLPGLVWRSNGRIINNGRSPFAKDLDKLPLINFDLLPELINNYHTPAHSTRRLPTGAIVTSRGCGRACPFCDRSVSGSQIRYHNAKNVVAMMDSLMSRGVRDIYIGDDNFCCSRNRVLDICKILIYRNIDLVWSCASRVDNVDSELLERMKQAGCWQIAFGIESGSQETLDKIRKGTTLDTIRATIQLASSYGLSTRGYFILGFPWESKQDVMKTIDFACSLPLDHAHFSYFTPYPGSELGQSLFPVASEAWGSFNQNKPIVCSPHLPAEKLVALYRYAFIRFYFRGNIYDRYMQRLEKAEVQTANFMVKGWKNLGSFIPEEPSGYLLKWLQELIDLSYKDVLKHGGRILSDFQNDHEAFPLFQSIWHGVSHVMRVAAFALAQAELLKFRECISVDTKAILLAALFHDVGRINEKQDESHQLRSIERFEKICASMEMPSFQKERVIQAIAYHNGHIPVDSSAHLETACLCNADRLDRYRFGQGYSVDPDLMYPSTPWKLFNRIAQDYHLEKNHFKVLVDLKLHSDKRTKN